MKYNKTCAYCGKEFETNRKNGRFCSPKCREIIRNESNKQRYYRKKAEAESIEVKENLAETVQKARNMGMSYGQYKAMIYKKMKGI